MQVYKIELSISEHESETIVFAVLIPTAEWFIKQYNNWYNIWSSRRKIKKQ